MKNIKAILKFIFTIIFLSSFIHKDRIEIPTSYILVFQNDEIIKLNNSKRSLIKSYSNDILKGRRKLKSAKIHFATGETFSLKNNGREWTEINIKNDQNNIKIPDSKIKKIPEIHLETITLTWNGNYKNSSNANYFYINFNIGKTKKFSEYPEMHITFSKNKFSKITVENQIAQNTKQTKDF